MSSLAAATPCTSYRYEPDEPDFIVVPRVCAGTLPHTVLSVGQRREVVRLLHRAGYSDHDIARRTGMASRTAMRIRHDLGLPRVPAGNHHGETSR